MDPLVPLIVALHTGFVFVIIVLTAGAAFLIRIGSDLIPRNCAEGAVLFSGLVLIELALFVGVLLLYRSPERLDSYVAWGGVVGLLLSFLSLPLRTKKMGGKEPGRLRELAGFFGQIVGAFVTTASVLLLGFVF